jgi:hypothetical protein
MLRHAASFVTNGGFLSTTATTPTSLLAEICRRIFLPFITSTTDSLDGQISRAIEIFEPQLNSLNTSTRPIRDWVLDSIFHPWENCQNMCFSILDCIDTLNSEFEFYGSSPKFLVDDRFYKRIGRSSVNSNILARQQYPALNLSLIDYRTSLIKNISWGASNDIESVCRQLYDIHDIIVHSGGYSELDNFIYHLKIVIDLLPSAFNETVSSINDFIENFPRFIQGDTSVDFQFFSKWWGRGQQYVSFLRNEE